MRGLVAAAVLLGLTACEGETLVLSNENGWRPENGDIVPLDPRVHCEPQSRWTVVHVVEAQLHAIWGTSSDDVWIAGNIIAHWDGTDWTEMMGRRDTRWRAIHGVASDDVWIAGDDGVVHWDGTSLSDVVTPANISALWANASDDVWFGAAGQFTGALYRWDGAEIRALDHMAGRTVSALWGQERGKVFAALPELVEVSVDSVEPAVTSEPFDARLLADGGTSGAWWTSGDGFGRFDGAVWNLEGKTPLPPYALFAFGDELYVGAASASLTRFDGERWCAEYEAGGGGGFAAGIWGPSRDDVWAVITYKPAGQDESAGQVIRRRR